MPRTSKKSQITYKTIVPMKKSVQEPKKTQSRFGIGIVPRQGGCDTMTCTRLAGMILGCPEVQDAISSLAPSDIYIVSVVATATPGLFLATLSNGSTFNIDLSALVENQQLSLAGGTLTISEGNSVDLCPVIAYCITNNGLPDGVDLFSLNGTIITSGSTHNITIDSNNNTLELEVDGITVSTAPIINSNDLSNTGLAITSTVNGIADAIDITSDVQALITSNTDSVTNTVAGHLIAIHTAVDNTVVNINETITSTIAVGTGIQTTNEDGSTNIITFPIINAGTPTASMEVRVDGVLVTTIPLVQYDIQIDNAGSDFNLVDDQLTFLETNGDTATINFSKYNISSSLVAGGVGIYQNGNLIATIPNTASGISIVDVGNYYTSGNVEGALQEIGSALNNTCSGNPLSPTNKLITTDSLTTNATLPANITGTPDTTDANNVFLKAEKRLSTTGCLEDVYVPSQIFTQRQLLTPTAIVTANPLAPTLINSASKDYYRSTVSYTVSVPTGGNYIVDVNACNHTTLIRHNSSGSILGRMVFGMLSFFGNGSDHYPGDIERITGASNVNAGTLSILGGASFSCVHQIDAVVDTGIALLTTTGVIVLPTQYCVATFYPSN